MSDHKTSNHMTEGGAYPFLQSMQREMTHFLDRFRGLQPSAPGDFFEALNTPVFPALDIAETEEAVEISAEIPGVHEEDLDISVVQDVLTLKGEKSSDHQESEQDYHVVERRYGSFSRRIPLGFVPAEGAVEARFNDGVLKLKIAKPAEAKRVVQKVKISKS